MGQVRKIKAGLVKISVNDFVGEDGNVFFDTDDGVMRLSDGTTPGGVPLSSGSAEGGASTFRQLLDTPSTFSGAASNFVKVNAQGSALEFVDVDLFDGDYANLTNKPTLFSGSYADLTNKPTLVTSYTALTDLPTLFSGSYTDLTNKPTLFDPSAITQDLIPNVDIAIDLGTITKRWRDLFLSGNTIYLGDAVIRNVGGTIDLPSNAKVNGRKIPLDISELTDTNNVLSSSGAGYSLPIATNNALGGIKVGTGLSIDENGVVTVTATGVTSYNDLTDLPSIPTVPTNISAFTNDSGYLTSVGTISYNDLSNLPLLFSGSYTDLTNKPTLVTSYNDLTDLPSIPVVPTTLSSFTNDSGYITGYTVSQSDVTQHQAALSITESQISDLKIYLTTVAFADLTSTPTTLSGYGITDSFSGSYTDLINTPTLFDGAYSSLSDTPDLSVYLLAVNAFSGNYTDLSNTPVIPTDISELTDNTNLISGSNITEDDLITYSILFG